MLSEQYFELLKQSNFLQTTISALSQHRKTALVRTYEDAFYHCVHLLSRLVFSCG